MKRYALLPVLMAGLMTTAAQAHTVPTTDAETVARLKAGAEAGEIEAQRRLGRAYLYGHYKLKPDTEAGRAWLAKGAEAGSAQASYDLGISYEPTAPEKGEPWFLKAAAAGNKAAYFRLCTIYRTTTLNNWDKALVHCRAAAENGDGREYANMALAIETGAEGRTADLDKAMTMYHDLAGWSDATATLRLADIYEARPSSPDNDAKLLRYTWLAAGFKPKDYLVRLARYHETGRAVTADAVDAVEAGRFYFHAARMGAPEAVTWIAAHPEVTQAAIDARALPATVFADGAVKFGFRRTDRTINDYYPERAYEDEVEGDASIQCRITVTGDFDNCIPVSETPRGYGFGAAVLRMVTGMEIFAPEPEPLKAHAGKLVQIGFGWKLN
jgi:TPR repeat protein